MNSLYFLGNSNLYGKQDLQQVTSMAKFVSKLGRKMLNKSHRKYKCSGNRAMRKRARGRLIIINIR